jgi:Tfp pilus assembly protein PilF
MAQAAVVADPARPTTYVALGDIYAETGEPDYARSYYDEALQIDPAAPSALKAIAALDGKHPAATAQAGP